MNVKRKAILALVLCMLTLLCSCSITADPANSTNPESTPGSTTPSANTTVLEPGTPSANTTVPEPGTPSANTTVPEPGTPPEATTSPEPSTPPAVTTAPEPTTPPVATTTPEPEPPQPPAKTYNILFIGNSFTFYNDMPTMIFQPIATAAGYKVKVSSITKGGWYLNKFVNPADEYGAKVHAALQNNTYDYVIIQEQSSNALKNPGDYYDAMRTLVGMVRANGATPILYASWGYGEQKTSAPTLSDYAATTAEMEMKLRAAFVAIAEELDLTIAHAGAAMTAALAENMDIYNTKDYYHPSLVGSNLVGWTIFSTIFGDTPASVKYNDAGLSAEVNAQVKRIVTEAALGEVTVEEAYKTSSIGVVAQKFTFGVDIDKTVMLTTLPESDLISVRIEDKSESNTGWAALSGSATKVFSGILGTKGATASKEFSETELTAEQIADISDIGYGVSVIGLHHMNVDKNGYKTSVLNICNGQWGASNKMAALVFDTDHYAIDGTKDEKSFYTGLITLNFGKKMTFDAIGYFSGNTKGFPQAQDVYVSDDGINWVKVESACYDVFSMDEATPSRSLSKVETLVPDMSAARTAATQCMFDMNGTAGQYIRIGVILGGDVDSVGIKTLPTVENQQTNFKELAVFGSDFAE